MVWYINVDHTWMRAINYEVWLLKVSHSWIISDLLPTIAHNLYDTCL
jgi:hypothetical protein